ncbi:MAG: hypothetical protein Q9200_004844 [Gallowayella weberi]
MPQVNVTFGGLPIYASSGTFIDPLEKAEQWFLGREEREDVMEVRRREVEESKLHKTQSTDPGDSECEEAPADRMAQTNHYLSAQEASGIYPTPPDGLTSHAASSVTAQDTPAASNLEVYPDLTTVDEVPEVDVPDADSPQETMPGGRFMKDEGQDLFGDMDTDMFDTNVLTEADFNFFDEPDDVDDQLEIAPDDQTGLHPQTFEVGNTPPSDGSREATQLDVVKLRAIGENDMEDIHHEILSPKTSPVEHDINPPSSDGITTQNRADKLKAASSTERRDVPQAIISKEKQSSFEVSALEGRPLVCDAKYLQEGKYAASLPEAQTSQKPSQRSGAPSTEIPRIGPLLHIDELSSDETEDGEADLQSLTDGDKDELSTAISGLAKVGMGSEKAFRSAKKRKRESSTDSECPATPAGSVTSTQANLEPSNELTMYKNLEYSNHRALHDIIGLLEDQPVDLHSIYVGTDQNFIQVAQLVTDQTMLRTGVFQLPLELTGSAYGSRPRADSKSPISLDHEILAELCHDFKQCDLKSYHELDLSVASDLSQKTTLQDDIERRRQAVLQSRESKSLNEGIYETQIPYLHVQRGQDAVHIAPPSLYFWEELGLAPSQQRKDVIAFCIYPDHRILRDAASTFMTTMQSSYQNCKLGSHRDGVGVSRKYVEGLVPVPIARTDAATFWDSLYKVADQLGGQQTNHDAIFLPATPESSPAAYALYDQIPTPDNSSPTVIHTPSRAAQNHPATPSAPGFSENDPSARLIDVVSKTWAMVSPTPIPDPYLGPPHLASVLGSGYLFKRAGAEDYDGLIPLGINLITTIISKPEARNCQTTLKTLREVLGMYSDLAMLARLRGLEEWKTGILPWHVAAARKARRIVTRCMRWGERKS